MNSLELTRTGLSPIMWVEYKAESEKRREKLKLGWWNRKMEEKRRKREREYLWKREKWEEEPWDWCEWRTWRKELVWCSVYAFLKPLLLCSGFCLASQFYFHFTASYLDSSDKSIQKNWIFVRNNFQIIFIYSTVGF
jgi:hypothetical protein